MVDYGPAARPTAAAQNNRSTGAAYVSRVLRPLKGGGVSSHLQIRLPARLQPPGLKWRKRSGSFPDTPEGLAEAILERDRQLAGLERARLEAAVRGRADYAITIREAVKEWRATPAAGELRTIRERERMLERDLLSFPAIAGMPARLFGKRELRAVLAKAAERGLGRSSLLNLKQAVRQVFEVLHDREQVDDPAWMRRVPVPSSRVELRTRVILTDDEFVAYVTCSVVPLADKVMACAARTCGGMRTSDLHAWDWSHVDTVHWLDAHVPRPRTRRHGVDARRHVLPEVAVRFLREWWLSQGRPSSGPVFPLEREGKAGLGRRKGERKVTRGISYAKRLRRDLLRAGITRRELHEPTDSTLPVDFHSFRRAYATALATSGVNVQQAMALAGHRQPATHMRYVRIAEKLSVPSSAVPSLPPDDSRSSDAK